MAQMIQIEDSTRRTINPAVGPTPTMQADANNFGGQIGRALQGAGQELQQFANYYAQEQQQRQQFQTTTSFIEQQSKIDAGVEQAARDVDGTDAKDFTKSTVAGVRAQWDEWAKKQNFTPEQRAQWDTKIAADVARTSKTALSTEFATYDKFQVQKLADVKDLAAKEIDALPVDATPQQFETTLTKVDATIDATNYSDEQKAALKKEWRDQATAVRIQSIAKRDPEKASKMLGMPGSAVDIVTDKIIGHESGGDHTAENPNSTASGVGQFIDSTWLATVRKHRPDLAGMSDAQILGMKKDPALGREMTKALTQDNANILAARGIPVTEANLYLMHFAGEGGGVKLLQASDNAAVEDVLGAGAVKANPFLEGKSVGWVKEWAGRVMSSAKATPGTMDPTTSNLSYKNMQDLRDFTTQQIKLQQAQAAADQQKAYSDWFNTFQTDLISGAKGRQAVDNAIANKQLVDANDIIKAYSLAGQREKGDADLGRFNAKVNDPGSLWDGNNDDDKDAVAAAVTNLGGGAEAAFQVWDRTGILDERGATKIRAGLNSTDPAQVKAAGQLAKAMLDKGKSDNPFAGVKGGEDILKKAVAFSTMVDVRGLEADEAAKHMVAQNDPTMQKKILPEQVTQFRSDLVKNMTPDKIVGLFDDRGLGQKAGGLVGLSDGPVKIPVGAQQASQLQSEFVLAAEDYYRQTGDADTATELAKREISRTWGRFNGALMKYPPSSAYPPVDLGNSGNPHSYIVDQANEDALQALKQLPDYVEGETIAGAYLKPIETTGQGKGVTEEAWRRGGIVLDNNTRDRQDKPRKVVPYELWYFRKTQDGSLIPEKAPLPFVADPARAEAQQRKAAATISANSQAWEIEQARQKKTYMENLQNNGIGIGFGPQMPDFRAPPFNPYGQEPLPTPGQPPSMTDEVPADPMTWNPGDF